MMLVTKRVFSALAVPVLLASATMAHAQVKQSATGSDRHLWGGVEYSSYHTDYNPGAGRLTGIGVYGDYYITHRLGVEATARFLTFSPPEHQSQKDYLVGPTVVAYQNGKLYVNAMLQLGGVFINYPYPDGQGAAEQYQGSYFALVPDGNVEYRFDRRFKVRGGYEFQFLPSAPGFPYQPSHGLTPTGFSIGLSYEVF